MDSLSFEIEMSLGNGYQKSFSFQVVPVSSLFPLEERDLFVSVTKDKNLRCNSSACGTIGAAIFLTVKQLGNNYSNFSGKVKLSQYLMSEIYLHQEFLKEMSKTVAHYQDETRNVYNSEHPKNVMFQIV